MNLMSKHKRAVTLKQLFNHSAVCVVNFECYHDYLLFITTGQPNRITLRKLCDNDLTATH